MGLETKYVDNLAIIPYDVLTSNDLNLWLNVSISFWSSDQGDKHQVSK